jgi:dipeptidyl aminopeptidase/acylaminoacyl peptidase
MLPTGEAIGLARFFLRASPIRASDILRAPKEAPLVKNAGSTRLSALCFAIFLAALLSLPAFAQDAGRATQPPAAKRNLALDDEFSIKEVSNPEISPDGKWVAYVVHTTNLKEDKHRSRIWMVPAAGGTAIPLTAESFSSSHPRWSPDGKCLAFLSARSKGSDDDDSDDTKTQVWILNREGGEAQQLTKTIQDVDSFEWSPASNRLVLILQDPTPDEIAAGKDGSGGKSKSKPHPWVIDRLQFKEDEIGYLDRRRKHLYVFDLATRKATQVTSGDYDDDSPAWSPDGRSLAFASNRTPEPDSNFNSTIWVVSADNTDKGQTPTHLTTGQTTDGSPAWSPDGKWIAYTSQLDLKLFQYATFHLAVVPATGGTPKILTRELDRSVSAPRFAPDGHSIYFIADDDGTQKLMAAPAAGGAIARPIGDRQMVSAYSNSRDGTVAAQISYPSRPDEVYVLPPTGSLRRVTMENDAFLAQLNIGAVDYVKFPTKDGTTAAGFIYKPPDFQSGKRYPTILIPHGGPVWAWYSEFNFFPQFLAANGFVVLTPNPRGSSGYGEPYCKAIFAGWGEKDFQDDMAEVDYAIAQGISDADKLGVMGHSYGAISTNFIIAQTTRFKAAISNAGEFLYTTNYGHDLYQREWRMELGLPWEHRDLWEKLSPFNSVTKIKTPTLLEGGDVDWNVPIINAEQMYQSLKVLGVPTMLVVYPGEYHEFHRPSFIEDIHKRDLYWMNHYLKGEGPAAPPAQEAAD